MFRLFDNSRLLVLFGTLLISCNSNQIKCGQVSVQNQGDFWFAGTLRAPSQYVDARLLECKGPYRGGYHGGHEFNVYYGKVEIDPSDWSKWDEQLVSVEKPSFFPKAYGEAKTFWFDETAWTQQKFYTVRDPSESRLSFFSLSPDLKHIYFYRCIDGGVNNPDACKKLNL